MKRPALQNQRVAVRGMASRARMVFGTLKKRAPGWDFNPRPSGLITAAPPTELQGQTGAARGKWRCQLHGNEHVQVQGWVTFITNVGRVAQLEQIELYEFRKYCAELTECNPHKNLSESHYQKMYQNTFVQHQVNFHRIIVLSLEWTDKFSFRHLEQKWDIALRTLLI